MPLRMLRGQRFDADIDENSLEVYRLLGPEHPIIVEDRDSFAPRHEIAAFCHHTVNERGRLLLPRLPEGDRGGWRRRSSACS